ncbi:MAG TPA: hypothetical protein ENN34_10195 [Deltaproteobacteria bacterium]|nr:hypothetical protein [Deltaproteobacteria bacterium]
MDPDTSKKVKDLLNLMEDISSDIDVTTELERIVSRIGALEQKVSELSERFSALEIAYREKLVQIQSLKNGLKTLFPEN